jgi:hypothetical protein
MASITFRSARVPAMACVLALALCGALRTSAAAQSLTSGALAGEVRSEADEPLDGTVITLTSRPGGGTVGVARTSRNGFFDFGSLQPGVYDALFELLGYYPVRIEGIIVVPGERFSLRVELPEVQGTPERVEVVRRSAGGGAIGTMAQRWVTAGDGALPQAEEALPALAELASNTNRTSFEGLPSSANVLVVDGFPRADRRSPAAHAARAAGLRLAFMSNARLMGDAVDVEWPSAAAGYFTAITRLAAGPPAGRVYGDWTADALAGGDAGSFQAYRAGADIGGTLADSGRFFLSAEFERSELPLASAYAQTDRFADLDAVVQQQGGDLSSWTLPRASSTERATVFGAAAIPLGDAHSLRAHGSFTALPQLDVVDVRTGQLLTPGGGIDGRDIFAGGTFASRLSETLSNELSVGFESGRVERTGDADALPLTQVVSVGAVFGSADNVAWTEQVQQIYARETLRWQLDSHTIKFGGWISQRGYDLDFVQNRAPTLVFATPDDLAGRSASYSEIVGTTRPADFSTLHYAVYVQDEWVPDPTVRLKAGVRVGVVQLPDSADVRLNTNFGLATALSNRTFERAITTFEPRFAVDWRPTGEWLVNASATVNGAGVAPEVMAELLSNDGGLVQQAAAVDVGSRWPDEPGSPITVGESLTLLGPKFLGPRTSRASGGIARSIGPFSLGIEATYRRTEFLPERRDLNLLPVAASHDQYGRPIYGPLAKVGGVVTPVPTENRRIAGFGPVWALESTATSQYTGVSFSFERQTTAGVGFLARYTYSKTEDDWLGGSSLDPQAQLSPFPDSLGGADWVDGTSDYDVPHRLVLGAELEIPVRLRPRIAALYRRETGAPFTPGFRTGVDVNGDGSGRNDPAYIDPGVPGIDALLGAWDCLQSNLGGFAERNACRTDDVQGLDARFSMDVVQSERFSAQLVVDALDLIASERVGVDNALYLVDPAGDLEVSAGGAMTTIPLIANPDFGRPLTRYAPQRRIRIGLRVRY